MTRGRGNPVWAVLVVGVVVGQTWAHDLAEADCDEGVDAVEMRLSLAESGRAVRVAYSLPPETRLLELSWPARRGAAARMSHLAVESNQAEVDAQGRVHFREPVGEVDVVVSPEPPAQRYGGQWPTAFAVDGRGIAVYVPYLMPKTPKTCGAVSVVLAGGAGVRAVADGEYHEVREAFAIADPSGFVLLGRNLKPKTTMQLPTTLPAWLDELIRESDERAHRGLVRVLGAARKRVPVFVDYFAEGWGGPRVGGDAAGEHCAMRLSLRGQGWEEHSELEERVFAVVAHELAHCYQEGENWLRWAHEGHARFLDSLLTARPDGKYLPGTRAEEGLVRDFDACMNDLRLGTPRISPYSCGSVAYWLRWLETGRVTMLEREDVDNPVERETLAGRFLLRTVDGQRVVEFLRRSGVSVEVEEEVVEGDSTVRARLVMTLLEHECSTGSMGLWTNESTITLDGCAEFDRLEVNAVAGRHIIDDVHASYEKAVASCREGKVSLTGVDGEARWIRCDPEHEWPSTVATRYRLMAPFTAVPKAKR